MPFRNRRDSRTQSTGLSGGPDVAADEIARRALGLAGELLDLLELDSDMTPARIYYTQLLTDCMARTGGREIPVPWDEL